MKSVRSKLFISFLLCIIIPWISVSFFISSFYNSNLKENYTKDSLNIIEQSLNTFNSNMTVANQYLDILFTAELFNSLLSETNFNKHDSNFRNAIINIETFLSSITTSDAFISGVVVFANDTPICSLKFSYWGNSIQTSVFYDEIQKANGKTVLSHNMTIMNEYMQNKDFMILGRQIKKRKSTSNTVELTNEIIGTVILLIDKEKILRNLKPTLIGGDMQVSLSSSDSIICSDVPMSVAELLKASTELHYSNPENSKQRGGITINLNSSEYVLLYANSKNSSFTVYGLIPSKIFYRSTTYFISIIIIAQVFCAAAFLTFTAFTQRNLTDPIRKLENAMSEVTQGNLSTTVTLKNKDELGRMCGSFNYMVSQINHMIEQIHIDYTLKNEMEISMLQYQINPHFIYNILSSIRLKALMNSDEDVALMLQKVSRLLSRTIGKSGKDIMLREEITNIEDFIFIHKNIFSNSLNTYISANDDILDCVVPNMLLQPIVENCFVHGTRDNTDNFCVLIKAVKQDDDLIITISDDGIGMNEQTIRQILEYDNHQNKDNFNKIGIHSINKRLKLSYGPQYGVSIDSKLECYTKVTIKIPYIVLPEKEDKPLD